MSFDEILVEEKKNFVVLTLNRPDRFNAFTTEMYIKLLEILSKISIDEKIKAVLITGAGKGFCSGSDVASRLGGDLQNEKEAGRGESLRQIEDLTNFFGNFSKPVITAINGPAVGAGLSIALISDIRLASEKARFGAVWVKVGLIPDMGATYYLPRVVGLSKAIEMTLTGELVDAAEALKIGLVSKVVPHDQLMDRAIAMTESIASGPAVAIKLAKRALHRSVNNNLQMQMDYESYAQFFCRQTYDHKEGINAYKEKRKPLFRGM